MSLNKPGSHLLLNCGKEVRLADVAERPKGLKPFSREKAEKALKAAAVSRAVVGTQLLGAWAGLVRVCVCGLRSSARKVLKLNKPDMRLPLLTHAAKPSYTALSLCLCKALDGVMLVLLPCRPCPFGWCALSSFPYGFFPQITITNVTHYPVVSCRCQPHSPTKTAHCCWAGAASW
jgi:hypothetical protein